MRKLGTKVVYNNSFKQLTDEQIELLSLGLNFGLTPKKFPLLENVTAAEVLCQLNWKSLGRGIGGKGNICEK